MADRCEVQIAYAIGLAEPVSIMVDTYGTGKLPEEQIEDKVRTSFDMKPAMIISTLDLKRPIYKKTEHMDILVEPNQISHGKRPTKSLHCSNNFSSENDFLQSFAFVFS